MVGFDFIAVVHRVELATYARATTTKSVDLAVRYMPLSYDIAIRFPDSGSARCSPQC